ncbi:hypothetical protein HGRIS_009938 [Hohenbuehelia grisea]|uniref:WD40 repeat-like protein n=1 Tax=Hohenbuehelia grisea TaxID=104357 RepID=A0ABR3J2P4_9AGAR
MLPTPSSSPVHGSIIAKGSRALSNRTNIPSLFNPLPTPPKDSCQKRAYDDADSSRRKRPRLFKNTKCTQESLTESEGESDVEMEDVKVEIARARRGTMFNSMQSRIMHPWGSFARPHMTTRPILESFVSSQKADVYPCEERDEGYALTVPYACCFSNASKEGKESRLAFATERGTIHIANTSRRNAWDQEPPRTTFQAHFNGVFDIKWSPDDTMLATASADQTAGITCPISSSALSCLRGHTSTIKCVAWDPHHRQILSTGSRDGTICLWDLRTSGPSDDDGTTYLAPVITLPGAHDETKKTRGRKSKNAPTAPSITSLLYPNLEPCQLMSSGSGDGILKCWDIRQCVTSKRSKAPYTLFSSALDPTTFHGSRRPRGITSIVNGHRATDGLIFALGTDSYVHTYSAQDLAPQSHGYTDENMSTNFYVRLALSPCGRWLASGGAGPQATAFLYDVSNAGRPATSDGGGPVPSVKLGGQAGDINAVDWAEDVLATCADDGTVRVWRPDLDVRRACEEDSEEKKWEWRWAIRP